MCRHGLNHHGSGPAGISHERDGMVGHREMTDTETYVQCGLWL